MILDWKAKQLVRIFRGQSLLCGGQFCFMFGDLPSPFTLPGRLHREGPGAPGAPGPRREAEC